MTPKEKAKDLLISYSFIQLNQETGKKIYNKTLKDAAKQCALIAVEEMKEMIMQMPFSSIERLEYLQQVKEEIQKL